MTSNRRAGRRDPGVRVTWLGLIGNLVLLTLKLSFGALSGSAGLVADGIHSASDMATDLAVLGGLRLARRAADTSHPYGHGRFETFAGGVVAGVLIVVGGALAWSAVAALYAGVENFPGIPVLVVASLSIVVKEMLYRRTIRAARSEHSPALQANAWHHRSDALSSVAVLLGGVGAAVGWGQADHIAGLVVGLMVIVAGGRTLLAVLHELLEGGVGHDELAQLEAAIGCVPGLREWHDLRTRRVGGETFIDLHVLVDPALSIVAAHRISTEVEGALRRACDRPANVTVHVEPDVDVERQRKAARTNDAPRG